MTKIMNRKLKTVISGVPLILERQFMIPPKIVRIFNNAQGGPYKYCIPDPINEGKFKSFPLPCTREILLLVEKGKL